MMLFIALAFLVVLGIVGLTLGLVLTRGSTPAPKPVVKAPTFGTVTSYLPSGSAYSIVDEFAAPDGTIYFAAQGASSNSIGVLSPSGQVTMRSVPGTAVGPIALASDGTVVTSAVIDQATYIVKLPPGAGAPATYQVPPVTLTGTAGVRTVFPIQAVVVGADGAVWFQRGQINRWDTVGGYTSALGKLTAGGAFTVFPFADRFYSPGGLVFDQSGNLWMSATCVCARNGFLEMITPGTAKVDSTGNLVTTKYTVPTKAATLTGIGPHPSRLLVVGNNLWFVEQQDDFATEQPTPANLSGAGAVGFIPLTSPDNSKIVEYNLPTFHSRPAGLALGGDGNLWVTESGTGKLARMTTSGQLLHEYTVTGSPDDIVTGPNGNVYFTGGGALNWNINAHSTGLTGTQFPVWNPYPGSIASFRVK